MADNVTVTPAAAKIEYASGSTTHITLSGNVSGSSNANLGTVYVHGNQNNTMGLTIQNTKTGGGNQYANITLASEDGSIIRGQGGTTLGSMGADLGYIFFKADRNIKIAEYADAGYLYVASGGNIGIDTDAPGEKFHVAGTARITGKTAIGSSTAPSLDGLSVSNTVQIAEKSSISSPAGAGWGTFWVSGSSPNVPMFTDDDGTTIQLGAGGAGGSTTQLQYNNGGAFGGVDDWTWDGTHMTIATGSNLIFGNTNRYIGESGDNLLIRNSETNGNIELNAKNDMKFFIDGAQKLHMDSLGHVGIGLTNPQTFSDVFSVQLSTNSGWPIAFTNAAEDVIGALRTDQGDNYIALASKTESDIRFFYNDAEANTALTIKGSGTTAGNVGIGTTAPATKLDVRGTLTVDSSDSGNNVAHFESNDGLCWASFNDNGTSDNNKVRVGANGNKLVLIGGGYEIARMEPGNNNIIWNYDGYADADQKFVAEGGATTMYIDNSTNARVGIGTTSPSTKLDVVNTSSNWGMLVDQNNTGNVALRVEGNYGLSIASEGQYPLNITTNGGGKLRMLDSGFLGLGTDSPRDPLDIVDDGTIKTGNDLIILDQKASSGSTNNNDTASAILWRGYTSDETSVKLGRVSVANTMDMTDTASTQDSYMTFHTSLDGTLAEKMRIDADGKVGIGTDSPTQKLQLKGDSTYLSILAADGSEGVSLGTAGSGKGLLYLRDASANNKIYFEGAGHSYINGGTFSVGTATALASAQTTILDASNPQLTLAYDGSNYTTFQVATGGDTVLQAKTGYLSLKTDTGGEYVRVDTKGDFRVDLGNDSGYAMRVRNSSGNPIIYAKGSKLVGIGTESPEGVLHTANNSGVNIFQRSNDSASYGTNFYIRKSRGTVGSESNTQDGDMIGQIAFSPYYGDYDNYAASISAKVTGTVAADTTPGYLAFSTAAAGANTVSQRMCIDAAGNVGIATTSPQQKLHVEGGFRFRDGNSSSQRLEGFGWNDNFALVVSGSDALALVGGTPGVRFLDQSANVHLTIMETGTNSALLSGANSAGLYFATQSGTRLELTGNHIIKTGQTIDNMLSYATAAVHTATTATQTYQIEAMADPGQPGVTHTTELTLPDGNVGGERFTVTCMAIGNFKPGGGGVILTGTVKINGTFIDGTNFASPTVSTFTGATAANTGVMQVKTYEFTWVQSSFNPSGLGGWVYTYNTM